MTTSDKTVLLLHGWPGTSDDYHRVREQLANKVNVVTPDLSGFGNAFEGELPIEHASAKSHASKLLAFIESNGIKKPVVAGYDIGSRIAQAMALTAPQNIAGLVITPPYPGIGTRNTVAELQHLFWYQHFHRLDVAADTLDGNRAALRAYIAHFYASWSYGTNVISKDKFERLVDHYARPGAFKASIAWYSANSGYTGSGKVDVPTTVLWPENDPLFPTEWADKLADFFTDASLLPVPNCGHFVPLEAPEFFANAIVDRLAS